MSKPQQQAHFPLTAETATAFAKALVSHVLSIPDVPDSEVATVLPAFELVAQLTTGTVRGLLVGLARHTAQHALKVALPPPSAQVQCNILFRWVYFLSA